MFAVPTDWDLIDTSCIWDTDDSLPEKESQSGKAKAKGKQKGERK